MDYIDQKMIKFYQSSEEFFKSKRDQRVILLTTKATDTYTKFNFENGDTLLFGRESAGVPEYVHNAIKYKLKVTVKKDGQVEVINCIDMSGVGNRCLKDAAESAANSILFEKDQGTSDVDKIGDTFYLLYTFAPKTE